MPRAHLGTNLGTAQTLADRSRNPRGTRPDLPKPLQNPCGAIPGTLVEPSRNPRGALAELSRNPHETFGEPGGTLPQSPRTNPEPIWPIAFSCRGRKKRKGCCSTRCAAGDTHAARQCWICQVCHSPLHMSQKVGDPGQNQHPVFKWSLIVGSVPYLHLPRFWSPGPATRDGARSWSQSPGHTAPRAASWRVPKTVGSPRGAHFTLQSPTKRTPRREKQGFPPTM